jgi:hypothetical protein
MNGKVRIISSADGERWEPHTLIGVDGLDLRDPKITMMPDGRMMLLLDGATFAGPEVPKKQRKAIGGQSYVAFSKDAGREWSPLQPILPKNEWLWRVTWHNGRAYGATYTYFPKKDGSALRLYSTNDGLHYDSIATLDPCGEANEATIRFLPDDTMLMLARREAGNLHALLGTSKPPYKVWTWTDTGHELGGPDFIVLPDGRMFAGGRRDVGRDPKDNRTIFAKLSADHGLEPLLDFPGGKDCGYPAFDWHDGLLWMTFYSAKDDIYLAKIDVGK